MAKPQNKEAELAYYRQYAQNLVGEGEDFPEPIFTMLFDQFGAVNGNGARLLDAGCGSGIYGKRLAQREYLVTGVDLCDEMVAIANTRNPVKGFQARQGDLEDLSLFPENHFDVIFFGQMLHHFPHIEKVMRATHHWLKKGGKMMILEPNGSSPINMMSKEIGRIMSLSQGMKKFIGTENERSLGHREIFSYLSQHKMKILKKFSLDFRVTISKEDPIPPLLRLMLGIREAFYIVAAKLLPPMYRGRITLIVAEKA